MRQPLALIASLLASACGSPRPGPGSAPPRERARTGAGGNAAIRTPALYDVVADPAQLRDLARDPAQAATVRALQQELSDWMVATSDFLPPPILPHRGAHGASPHGGH